MKHGSPSDSVWGAGTGKLRLLLGACLLALLAVSSAQIQAAPAAAPARAKVAPTYRIYATREGLVGEMTGNGHIIQPRDHFVALPSWSVLSPQDSDKFSVRITYKGRSVVVPVWDVGPWNTKDDYWNPQRRYSDLPVGRPMAEAAVIDGYNGGLDERGRKILMPNGIDIADGTFLDDLQMRNDDWVQVSFLWLGTDPGPGAAVTVIPPSAPARAPAPPPPPARAPVREPAPTPTPLPAPPPVAVEEGAIVVDNGGDGYAAQGEPWNEASCGVGGTHAWTKSTSNPQRAAASATWTPQLPSPGYYEVLAYIPTCGNSATSSAHYRVFHDGATTEVKLDQRASAGTWASLGAFHFGGDGNAKPRVELGDLTDDDGRAVRFDALAWASRVDTSTPDAQILEIRRKDNGYQITWGSAPNSSRLASYDVQVRRLPKGGWTDWKRGATETSAWWGPDEGKQFAFRARGTDLAGRKEPWPEGADMDTTQATP